ncbi:MAG: AAA family ATPase, partial [Verrucomicrobiota bacterium]
LSIVVREDEPCFHLGGTNFFEPITDPEYLALSDLWNRDFISENDAVYRGEFLAWQILKTLEQGPEEGRSLLGADSIEVWLKCSESDQLEGIQRFMGPRYAEGYTKGIHDRDAARLLETLLPTHQAAGLLRFAPEVRACGLLFWEHWVNDEAFDKVEARLRSFGQVRQAFSAGDRKHPIMAFLSKEIAAFLEACPGLPFAAESSDQVAAYLFSQFSQSDTVAVSPQAAELSGRFTTELTGRRLRTRFEKHVSALNGDPVSQFGVQLDWMRGYAGGEENPIDEDVILEAVAHLPRSHKRAHQTVAASMRTRIEGLSGEHPLLVDTVYDFSYNRFLDRLRAFETTEVPLFEANARLKSRLLEDKREGLRLEEFKPRVLSSFVRNQLLDSVYLPMIGDNLAKQIGAAGADTRTDRMGMLLLISPPGYGKTTLMEYVANRLGIIFMKINGPAIGHDVTSLDPNDAPNAGAREEVNKLNLALEMGDNVMIYVDDIQHCHPEFLQKFISLCDAQRKIEGVYNGKPRTYDLRGKKVAVVMAGNPYTESGGKFQIPDMLANRADTYNLGDIIGGHAAAFEASYIENAVTSNPALNRLASRSQNDVQAIMKIARTGTHEGVDFDGNYATEDIEEMVSVTKKLMRVRDTILRVNLEYIRSAAMEDQYRVEPAFRLQGSYRNMNRMAEKILGLMTDEEVEAVILDHYENESQTLTTGAEANLLKFRELEGILTEEESERWREIKETFARNNLLNSGGDDNPVNRVVSQLGLFADHLKKIEGVMRQGLEDQAAPATLADVTVEKLEAIIENLRSVPVDVEIKVVPVQEGGGKREKKSSELPVEVDSKVKQKE